MTQTKKTDYTSLNDELESIIYHMQTGELGLDETMALYKRGTEIVKQMRKYLQTAQNQIKKVRLQNDTEDTN